MMHRHRRKVLEDSHNHERWLISYADFMTLLFGFFVVMYAISSVNEGKYKVLSSALNEVFAQRDVTLAPIQVGETSQTKTPNDIDKENPIAGIDDAAGDTYLQSMATDAQKRLAGVLGKGDFDVKGNDQWLEINLDAAVLFETGEASLGPLAHDVLERGRQHARRREESGHGRGLHGQRTDFDCAICVELGTIRSARGIGGARVCRTGDRSGPPRGGGLWRTASGCHQRDT